MIDSVKVTYNYSLGSASISHLFDKVSVIANSYHVDFDLRVTRNNIQASVYPFRYKGAKTIDEKQGALILSSLVCAFEDTFRCAHLLSVDMETALPF